MAAPIRLDQGQVTVLPFCVHTQVVTGAPPFDDVVEHFFEIDDELVCDVLVFCDVEDELVQVWPVLPFGVQVGPEDVVHVIVLPTVVHPA